jgi:hypothetical protein
MPNIDTDSDRVNLDLLRARYRELMRLKAQPAPEVNPDLVAARAQLLAQIKSKPEPEPKPETDAQAEERWRRRGRLALAQQVLRAIRGNLRVAVAIGCTPRAVAYWRKGSHSPSIKYWRRLQMLRALLIEVGDRVEIGIRVDRARQDAAD